MPDGVTLLLAFRPDRVTTADLRLRIGDHVVWPVRHAEDIAVEIQIDDLLSHLTDFWKPLMLRQVYPLPVAPPRPSAFRFEAERRWAAMPAGQVEAEADILDAFEDAHDLSRAFAGQFGLPSLWLLRSGQVMICEAAGRTSRIDYQEARAALTATGDAIASRLLAGGGERWADLVAAWERRDEGDAASLLAWSIGAHRDRAVRLIEDDVLTAPATVPEAANDDDELRLAARMAGALPEAQMREVIALARGVAKTEAPDLLALAERVQAHVMSGFGDRAPYAQGEAAATFVRADQQIASVQYLDIFALCERLGAFVRTVEVQPPTLDGLAVWGPRHGPGALINLSSRRLVRMHSLATNGAARITLAHELCHLLLDRGHALSAVDVLGGRMAVDAEQRARAFAAELLLPAKVAGDAWVAAGGPETVEALERVVGSLARKYGVSRSVATWKLEHGADRHGANLARPLDLVAPDR